jgi:hypothetical protein
MKPIAVSDADLHFPGKVEHLLPPWAEIPEEFFSNHCTHGGYILTHDMFFSGATNVTVYPKDDIDPELAWRHVRTVMGTWSIKHEHKMAACTYLFNEWFTRATWETKRHAKDSDTSTPADY